MYPSGARPLRVAVTGEAGPLVDALSERSSDDGPALAPERVAPAAVRRGGDERNADCLVVVPSEGDGLDLAGAAVETHPALPVVLLVGRDGQHDHARVVREALRAGVDETLPRRLAAEAPGVVAERIASIVERERARHRSAAYDALGDAVAVRDPETGALVDANGPYADLLGREREDLLGAGVEEAGAAGEGRSRVERAAAADEPVEFDWTVETEGETRPTAVRATTATVGGRERYVAVARAAAARRERQRRLEAERDRRSVLFESSPDPIMAVELVGGRPHVTEVNPAFESVFGFDADSVTGRPIVEAIVPEGEREQFARLRERAARGEPVEAEVRRETADGVRDFLLRILPFSAGGDAHAYVWYTDVTERKERERAIEEEREKYSTLVEQSSDAVVVVQDGEYAFVNERFADLTGYDRSALVGQPFEEVFTPEYRDLVRERYRRRVAGDEPPNRYDVEVETADGDVRTLEGAVSRITHGGEPATLANFRDVTERERRQRAIRTLRDASERMQAAETASEVAGTAVEAAREAMGAAAVCWLRGDDGRRLDPAAATDDAGEHGSFPSLTPGHEAYAAFREDEVKTWRPEGADGDGDAVSDPLAGAVVLPLDEHGLIAAGPDGEHDEVSREVARTLAEQTTTALDRVERARAVRESERRFRLIAERIDQVIFLAAPDFSEAYYVNDAYEEIWGRPVAELFDDARSFVDYVDPRDREAFDAEFGAMLADVERGDPADSYEFEFRIERPDGEVRWVRATGYPVGVDVDAGDGDSVEPRFVGIAEDVTERRHLERTYRAVFENVSDGLVVHDPETGEIVDVNDRFCEMNGYEREQLVGERIDVVTAPDHAFERAGRLIDRARREGSQLFEWRNQRSDGETYPVEVHLSVVDVRGEERVLASVRDITERKRREREYERIFNGVNDAIAIHDPETGDLLDVNDTYVEQFGYDAETIRDLGVEGLSVTEQGFTKARGDEIIRRVAESGESETVEWKVEHADGEERVYEVNATAATIGGEERVLTINRDVTERRRREREYEQIFNGVNDIVNVYDPETGELVEVNDTMCEVTGYDRETILDRGLELVSATDEGFTPGRAREVMDGVMDAEESREVEWCLETADGERRWLEVSATPATINGEERLLTIARDVTERRQREREYEQIFNGVTDAITVHDPGTGELVDVNDTTCDLTGYDRETLLAEGQELINVPEEGYSSERARGIVREVMEAGEGRSLEWLIEREDGERRWLEVNATPATINGEESYLAIMRDVTERRRTERRLRAILDRIDEAIFLGPAHEITQASQNPDFLSSGYEEIWGQPLEDLHERYEDGFFGTLHPDDEGDYRAHVERVAADVAAGEAADSYSTEYRIRRPDGEVRWVQSDYYPIEWESGPPRIVIVSRDVTDRKERERRMASFDEATEDLTTADTPEEAARLAVEAASEALDLPAVGAFLYDDESGVLRPEALSEALADVADHRAVGPGDGPLWEAFATGAVVDPDRSDASGDAPASGESADAPGAGAGIPDGLSDWRAVALGNHGVLLVGAPGSALDTDTLQAAHVLGATLEAALNHLQGRRRLAVQEEQLRTQTERAERLDRIARLTRRVEGAITEASTPAEVERAVCERLAGTGPYELAWIGGAEVGEDRLGPRAVVGAPTQYVEGHDLPTTAEGADRHPAVRAWQTDDVHVAGSLVDDGPTGAWRRRALAEGYQSLCAVPLTYDGITHGVLVVGASTPNAFGDRERGVLEQLGTSVGYALAAIERRRALESDETVELEFHGAGTDLPFARAAREAGCRVRHERTGRRRDGDVSVYFAFEGDVPDDVGEIAGETLPGNVEVVTDEPAATLVEVETDAWFGSPLAEFGAVLRRAVATPEETTVVAELPAQGDVRSFTGRLRELAPELELVAKRQHHERERTPEELRTQVGERLTDRQQEALRAALSAGYFEWPRENDGSEVAERLDITQPTLNKHLRHAERKTFELLFDDAPDGEDS